MLPAKLLDFLFLPTRISLMGCSNVPVFLAIVHSFIPIFDATLSDMLESYTMLLQSYLANTLECKSILMNIRNYWNHPLGFGLNNFIGKMR